MNRRKFLIGAGSLAAGSAAAMGTGAFTSVEANRSLTVQTADDADALLSLDAIDDSPNSEYVDTSGDGPVSIAVSTDEGGVGVNADAKTFIDDLLIIENLGTQDVFVWMEGSPSGFDFYVQNDSPLNTFKNNGSPADGADKNTGAFSPQSNFTASDPTGGDDAGTEAAPLLGPGDAVVIHGYADGSDVDFDADITINAVAQSEYES